MPQVAPVVMMGVGMATSLIGTGVSIYTGMQGANAQAEQARINGELSARESLRQAEVEKNAMAISEDEARRQNKRRKASMEAGYAKGGVALSGTPMAYLLEQTEADEFNIEIAKWNSNEKINALLTSANNAKILGANTASSYKSSAIGSGIAQGIGFVGSTAMNSASFFNDYLKTSPVGDNKKTTTPEK